MLTRRTDSRISFGVLAMCVAMVVLSLWLITSTGVATGAPPGGTGGAATNSGIPELQASLDGHELATANRIVALEAANAQRAVELLARIDTLEAANATRESTLLARVDTLEAANALRATNQEAANSVRTETVRDDIDALRPRQLSYRDRLVDVNGIAIVLGKRVTFAIYADEAKTTKLWEHTADIYPDIMGYYNIVFGEEAGNLLPASVFEGPARYLAVSVGGNLPTLPPPTPGTSGEIPLQTIYPNVPTHRLESNFDTMLNQAFPDVELGLAICGAIDGSYHAGGVLDFGLGVSAEANANTSVLPLGVEGAVSGFLTAGVFGDLNAGITVDGSACLETSFPVLTPVLPEASGQALGAPAGFEPLDIVVPLTSASQQIGTTPEKLEDALTVLTGVALDPNPADPIAHIQGTISGLPSPGNLDSFISAPELAPGSLLDLDLGCNGPINRPLANLLNEICSEAAVAAAQAFFQTIDRIKTGVDTLETTVDTVQTTVDAGVDFLNGQLTVAKNAIDSEITAAETFVSGQIGAARDDVNGKVNAAKVAIDSEITAAETFVSGQISAARDDVNGKVNAAKVAIDTEITAAETFIVGKVTEINDASLVVEQALADGITTEITLARDNVNATVAAVQSTANAISGAILNDLQPKVSNIQFVLGTERPVDNGPHNNGAHPVSFWAFHAWNNIVLARDDELSVIRTTGEAIKASVLNDLQPKVETIRASVINELQPNVETIRSGVDYAANFLRNEMGESPGRPEGRTYGQFLRTFDGKMENFASGHGIDIFSPGGGGGGLPDLPDFPF